VIEGPLTLPDGLWEALVAAHQTPPRHYHTFSHVEEVAQSFRRVPGWRQPREVFLAILFHDAVYVAGRSDNEARSATLAEAAIREWTLEVDPERVSTLIALTARHGRLRREEVDRDAARFLDCDMAILASELKSYAAYEAGIAAEYEPVYGAAFRAGRRDFLERLLAQPIFLSEWFRDRYEHTARANLQRSLQALGPLPDPPS